MGANLEKYKNDLDKLIEEGGLLSLAIQSECFPDEFEKIWKEALGVEYLDYKKKIPNFRQGYQSWYSEALLCVKQLLPDRLKDFTELYKPTLKRKGIDINNENYTIFDYLLGIQTTRDLTKEPIASPDAAIPKFTQQLEIVKSIKKRFESSLFDIKQLVQADLFDSELDAARELNKKGFTRGAGAIAGVILEKHLAQVCENHNLAIKKKATLIDYYQTLKDNDVIEVATWRFIQHLSDIRNLCVHNKDKEPKKEEIEELINGVDKITKTLF
jgi:hypothetical protein